MLVVVDMQESFYPARNRRTIKNVKREMMNARKRREPIVVLECLGCGPTLRCIKELAKRVKAVFVTKSGQDGSHRVFCSFEKQPPPKRIRVCGVLTDQCVASTARGLALRYKQSKIVVVGDACNSDGPTCESIEALPTYLPNCKFVKSYRKRSCA